MKNIFGPTQLLILMGLLALILAPRPIAGALDLKLAQQLDAAGDEAEATQAYAMAAERMPWMRNLWEIAGMKALDGGGAAKAISFFNRGAENSVLTTSGWLALGSAYKELGKVSEAIEAWKHALPLARADSYLAAAARGQGDFSAAIGYWRANIELEPESGAAHYSLGLLLAATDPEHANPELILAADLCPALEAQVQSLRTALNTAFLSDDRGYQFLVSGQALGAQGEWDLAAEAFRNASIVRPNYGEAWAWIAQAKQQQGQDGSLEIGQAITFSPNSAVVQGLYGMFLQREGKPADALEAFHKAAYLEPGNPAWQIALGSASEQSGDLIAAFDFYVHAVELAPEDVSTLKALVLFSVNNSVDVESTSLPAARKLIALAPNDWQSFDLAGEAESSVGNNAEAAIYLEKAVKMGPSEAAPALHLGLVYLQTGERTSAYNYLTIAKTLDPDGPLGWQAGRLLEQYFPQ
jgi:tetratricopeptide (TPR) repeat protein